MTPMLPSGITLAKASGVPAIIDVPQPAADHQQAFFSRAGFKLDFIFQRDVIGEHHHVEVAIQRLIRQLRRILASH